MTTLLFWASNVISNFSRQKNCLCGTNGFGFKSSHQELFYFLQNVKRRKRQKRRGIAFPKLFCCRSSSVTRPSASKLRIANSNNVLQNLSLKCVVDVPKNCHFLSFCKNLLDDASNARAAQMLFRFKALKRLWGFAIFGHDRINKCSPLGWCCRCCCCITLRVEVREGEREIENVLVKRGKGYLVTQVSTHLKWNQR